MQALATIPSFAGDDLLSRLVNVVINSPLFGKAKACKSPNVHAPCPL